MAAALELAREAAAAGEIPVGAVVLGPDGAVVGRGRNSREEDHDPTGHAEVNALRAAAAARGDRVLSDCTLVVTLEPCPMCAGAILAARIGRVVFGAWDEKGGAAGSVYDLLRDGRLPSPVPEVVAGVRADECSRVISDFFGPLRPSGASSPTA